MELNINIARFKVIHSRSPENLEKDLNDWIDKTKSNKEIGVYIEDVKIAMIGNSPDCFATICCKVSAKSHGDITANWD